MQRRWVNTGKSPAEIGYSDGAGSDSVLIVDPGHELITDDDTPIGEQITAAADTSRLLKES